MLEAYSKPCKISKMMRQIENPGIVRTVRHIHVVLIRTKPYSELCVTLTYTTVPYSELWHIYKSRHVQKLVEHSEP